MMHKTNMRWLPYSGFNGFVVVLCSLFAYPSILHLCSVVLHSNNILLWWLMAVSATDQKVCMAVSATVVYLLLYLVLTILDSHQWLNKEKNHQTTKLRPIFLSSSRWCSPSFKLNGRLRHVIQTTYMFYIWLVSENASLLCGLWREETCDLFYMVWVC
jgi:hypothetical protein